MKLKHKFINHFLGSEEITTKEIISWYSNIKNSDNPYTHHSTVHQLVINPLLAEGTLERITKGIYKLIVDPFSKLNIEELDTPVTEHEEQDEFDQYLESKLKKGGIT